MDNNHDPANSVFAMRHAAAVVDAYKLCSMLFAVGTTTLHIKAISLAIVRYSAIPAPAASSASKFIDFFIAGCKKELGVCADALRNAVENGMYASSKRKKIMLNYLTRYQRWTGKVMAAKVTVIQTASAVVASDSRANSGRNINNNNHNNHGSNDLLNRNREAQILRLGMFQHLLDDIETALRPQQPPSKLKAEVAVRETHADLLVACAIHRAQLGIELVKAQLQLQQAIAIREALYNDAETRHESETILARYEMDIANAKFQLSRLQFRCGAERKTAYATLGCALQHCEEAATADKKLAEQALPSSSSRPGGTIAEAAVPPNGAAAGAAAAAGVVVSSQSFSVLDLAYFRYELATQRVQDPHQLELSPSTQKIIGDAESSARQFLSPAPAVQAATPPRPPPAAAAAATTSPSPQSQQQQQQPRAAGAAVSAPNTNHGNNNNNNNISSSTPAPTDPIGSPFLLMPMQLMHGTILQSHCVSNEPRRGSQMHLDALSVFRTNFAHDKMQEMSFIAAVGLSAAMPNRPNTAMFRDVVRMALQRMWSFGGVDLGEDEQIKHVRRDFGGNAGWKRFEEYCRVNAERLNRPDGSALKEESSVLFTTSGTDDDNNNNNNNKDSNNGRVDDLMQQFFRDVLNDACEVQLGRVCDDSDIVTLFRSYTQKQQQQPQAVWTRCPFAARLRYLSESPRVLDLRTYRLDHALLHQWIRSFTIAAKDVVKVIDRVSPRMTSSEIDVALASPAMAAITTTAGGGGGGGFETPERPLLVSPPASPSTSSANTTTTLTTTTTTTSSAAPSPPQSSREYEFVTLDSALLAAASSTHPSATVALRITGAHLLQAGTAVLMRVSVPLGMQLIDSALAMLTRAHAEGKDTTVCWAWSSVSIALLRRNFPGAAKMMSMRALETHREIGDRIKKSIQEKIDLRSSNNNNNNTPTPDGSSNGAGAAASAAAAAAAALVAPVAPDDDADRAATSPGNATDENSEMAEISAKLNQNEIMLDLNIAMCETVCLTESTTTLDNSKQRSTTAHSQQQYVDPAISVQHYDCSEPQEQQQQQQPNTSHAEEAFYGDRDTAARCQRLAESVETLEKRLGEIGTSIFQRTAVQTMAARAHLFRGGQLAKVTQMLESLEAELLLPRVSEMVLQQPLPLQRLYADLLVSVCSDLALTMLVQAAETPSRDPNSAQLLRRNAMNLMERCWQRATGEGADEGCCCASQRVIDGIKRNLAFTKLIVDHTPLCCEKEEQTEEAEDAATMTSSSVERLEQEVQLNSTDMNKFPVSLLGLRSVSDYEYCATTSGTSSSSGGSSSKAAPTIVPESCSPVYGLVCFGIESLITAPAQYCGEQQQPSSSTMPPLILVSATVRESPEEQKKWVAISAASPVRRSEAVRLFSIIDNRVVVYRRCEPPFEVFARYTLPRSLRVKAKRLIDHTVNAPRHPNILMALVAIKHRDGNVDVDVEYADGGTMTAFIPKFDPEYRELVAMSTVRQVLQAIVYLDVAHSGQRHRHICPRYVYMRRDGCVKLDVPDMFDRATVEANQDHFLESPYTAPECRESPSAFCEGGDSRSDLWSLGVLICAIVSGQTFYPREKARRAGDPAVSVAAPPPLNVIGDDPRGVYMAQREIIDALVTANDDALWQQFVKNDYLRFFARRFLQMRPELRGNPAEALALTHVFGGFVPEAAVANIARRLQPVQPEFTGGTSRPNGGDNSISSSSSLSPAAPPPSAASSVTSDDIVAVDIAEDEALIIRSTDATSHNEDGSRPSEGGENSGVAAEQQPQVQELYETQLLVIKGKTLPHPWAMDRAVAFDMPRMPELYKAAMPLRASLGRARRYTLPEDTRGIRDITVEQLPAAVKDLVGNVTAILVTEHDCWGKARNKQGRRTEADRGMREIVRRRSSMTWLGMSYAVDWSRARSVAAREMAAAAAAAAATNFGEQAATTNPGVAQ